MHLSWSVGAMGEAEVPIQMEPYPRMHSPECGPVGAVVAMEGESPAHQRHSHQGSVYLCAEWDLRLWGSRIHAGAALR
jgi:hypothetical protein